MTEPATRNSGCKANRAFCLVRRESGSCFFQSENEGLRSSRGKAPLCAPSAGPGGGPGAPSIHFAPSVCFARCAVLRPAQQGDSAEAQADQTQGSGFRNSVWHERTTLLTSSLNPPYPGIWAQRRGTDFCMPLTTCVVRFLRQCNRGKGRFRLQDTVVRIPPVNLAVLGIPIPFRQATFIPTRLTSAIEIE